MKRILLIAFITICLLCAIAAADQIPLQWYPPANAGELPDGIELRYQLFHKMEQNSVFDFSDPIYDGLATQYTDTQDQVGNHRYAVWAYYTWTDGTRQTTGLSNTVNYEIMAGAPDLDAPQLMIEGIDQIQGGLDLIRRALVAQRK